MAVASNCMWVHWSPRKESEEDRSRGAASSWALSQSQVAEQKPSHGSLHAEPHGAKVNVLDQISPSHATPFPH